MDKVVEACTRVEGCGNLIIYLKNDEIYQTELNFSVFRGFENILVGKKLLDIPKIVSRICGLCYASQTIASCKAITPINFAQKIFIIRRINKIAHYALFFPILSRFIKNI